MGAQKPQHPMPQRRAGREESGHGSPSPQALEQPSEGAFSRLPSSNCSEVGPLIQAVSDGMRTSPHLLGLHSPQRTLSWNLRRATRVRGHHYSALRFPQHTDSKWHANTPLTGVNREKNKLLYSTDHSTHNA